MLVLLWLRSNGWWVALVLARGRCGWLSVVVEFLDRGCGPAGGGGGMVWYGMPYGIGSGLRAAPSRSPCLGPGSGASLP